MSDAFDFVAVDNRKDLPEGVLDATKYNSLKDYVKATKSALDTIISQVSTHLSSAHIALGETSATAYAGDKGKAAYDHVSDTDNPHEVTLAQIGAEPADANIQTHIADTDNPHGVTASQIGLGNVSNHAQIPLSQKGAANGVAELNEYGYINTSQIPGYLNDVQPYDTKTGFPGTGETGILYIALDTNLAYLWSGSAYVEVSPSLALGETSATAYRGDRGKTAYDHSQATHAPAGAEVNVQSNWTTSDTSDDAYIKNKPPLGTASEKNVPATGNASATEVVFGSDTRLTDARTPTSHVHEESDITGLSTSLSGKSDTTHTHTDTYEPKNANIQSHISSAHLALGETSSTAYAGDKGKTAYDHSQVAHAPATAEANVSPDWTATEGDGVILHKPPLGTAAAKDIPAEGNASTSEVVYGTDTRLSDTRTPKSHTHGEEDITNLTTNLAGKSDTGHTHSSYILHSLATDVSQFLVSSGAGVFVMKTLAELKTLLGLGNAAYKDTGTSSGTVAAGDDSRFTNARTPTSHNLVDTTGHPVTGLTTGHFLKATSATAYGFGAHGLTASDVGAEPTIATKNTAFNKNYGATATDVKVNGTQAVGSVDAVARIDHVHPTDTGRAAASHASAHVTGGGDVIANAVAAGNSGLMTGADKTKLDGIATGANNYSLPVATSSVLGGVKQGENISIDGNGVISSTGGSASVLHPALITIKKVDTTISAIGRTGTVISSGTVFSTVLQAAIDCITASDYTGTGGEIRVLAGLYTLTATVEVKPHLKLVFEKDTVIQILTNIDGFYVDKSSGIYGSVTFLADVASPGYQNTILTIFGSEQVTSTAELVLSDLMFVSAYLTGTAIKLIATGGTSEVPNFIYGLYVDNIRIDHFEYGIMLYREGTDIEANWINGNRFTNIWGAYTKYIIAMGSDYHEQAGFCSNFFENIQHQAGADCSTPTVLIEGNRNIFNNILIWDWAYSGASGGPSVSFNDYAMWNVYNAIADLDSDVLATNTGYQNKINSITFPQSSLSEVYNKLNTIHSTLGSSVIKDLALVRSIMTNKLQFIPPTSQEQSANGTDWSASTRLSSTNLLDLMIGYGHGANGTGQNGIEIIPITATGQSGYYRLEWDGASGSYYWLEFLYMFLCSSGNNLGIKIEQYLSTGWVEVCSGTVNNWPGHVTSQHSVLAMDSDNVSTEICSKVRITFSITNSSQAYPVYLNSVEWYGSYPAGQANLFSVDAYKGVTFPDKVRAFGGLPLAIGVPGPAKVAHIFSSADAKKQVNSYTTAGYDCQVTAAQNDYFIFYLWSDDGSETILDLTVNKANNRGIFTVYINGTLDAATTYDMYASSAASSITSINLTQPISSGMNTIKLLIGSKHASSSGYSLAVAAARIR